MSDRVVILLIGLGTIAAAVALALTGHDAVAGVVVTAGLGVINIFLRTGQHETKITMSNSQHESSGSPRDAAAPSMEIRSDDTGVIKTATREFLHVGASQQLPAMTQTDSGRVVPVSSIPPPIPKSK